MVVLAPPLSLTVAPATAIAPGAPVTVPVSAPVVGEGTSAKLVLGVVCPAVTVAAVVWEPKPALDAVRV